MIRFNKGEEKLNKFLGSERKTTVLYENEVYMIKYPDPVRDKRNALSYMNNQFSEHIGCRIFLSCGFLTQETALGYFQAANGAEKIVVGCKDFTQDGGTLHEFSKLGNQAMVDGKIETTIESVYGIIEQSKLIRNKRAILEKFWDMFVVDALLANPDRHFDNWGIFEKDGEITFAPIYDCGSSLGALLGDETMERLLEDPSGFKSQEFNATSCYSMNERRIFYHEIFKNSPADLAEAILRVVPKINMEEIHAIVDSVEAMSELRKDYLKQALTMRYEQILFPAWKRLQARDQGTVP